MEGRYTALDAHVLYEHKSAAGPSLTPPTSLPTSSTPTRSPDSEPKARPVEWAAGIGRPTQFTAEWAYTALSRARTQTRLHGIAEPSSARREREQYAPPEPTPTLAQALDATRAAMKRPAAEQLALMRAEPQELPKTMSPATLRLPLAELAEAGAEHPNRLATDRPPDHSLTRPPPAEPNWRWFHAAREAMTRGPSIQRYGHPQIRSANRSEAPHTA